VVEGFDRRGDDIEDRLYKSGCSDALIAVVKGIVVLDFTREAKSFKQALESAIRDVRKAGGRVVRIEPDSYASLSDIAERAGLTRQAVSLLVQGKRGAGDFPPPALRVTTESPLWDWLAVAQWLERHGKLKDKGAIARAASTRAMNILLQNGRQRSAA
jgi:transcriptional regulator with XRE-family HTH domain